MGMTAMAVDIGSYSSDRRNLQNAADAIALAAAKDLPDSNAAMGTANQYAIKNHISPSDMTVTISGGNTAPQVRVVISVNHNFSFIRALGVNSKAVSGAATAAKVSFGGSNGIVPWGVTQATVDGAGDGQLITLKYDSTGGNNGAFGAIRIDGTGSTIYLNDVSYGSSSYLCAVTAPQCTTGACPASYPNVCGETSPTCDGPQCAPETGNMVGPTRTGTDFRMNNTSTTCDTFTEAFSSDAAGYHLQPGCNPWLAGNTCPQTATPCSRRVIMIPVIDAFGGGVAGTVLVQRFALLYLEGYTGTCSGSNCDIMGRFVRTAITTNALAGSYDPGAQIHFTKLVE
jgi:hypothetical protein